MTTLLYVEDDIEIGNLVRSDLEDRGYDVLWLKSGENAASMAHGAHLAILDVMLPGLDGFTVGQRLKKELPELPILMLSARTSIDDKLQGLEFADDYLTKPFHPDELAARVEVLLRRNGQALPRSEHIVLHHLNVYMDEQRIVDTATNEEIVLTGKQFHILIIC